MKKFISTTLTLIALASMATTAVAGQSHRRHHRVAKRSVERPVARRAVAAPVRADVAPMVGTWTLRDGDKPRKDIRMVFRPNGTFAFVGPNWQSTGMFHLKEHAVALEWTSVDGSKVKPGTMKKDFPMADDNGSFRIDQYTYYKLGN